MPSFQCMVFDKVELRRLATEMPSALLLAANRATLANSSAAWISAFEGMQPMLRQVPPGLLRLDHHRVDAELSCPDRADIAARARADHQKLAGNVSQRLNPP